MDGPFDNPSALSLIAVRNQGGLLLGKKTRGYGKGKLVMPGGKDKEWRNGIVAGYRPAVHDAMDELAQETGLIVPERNIMPAGSLIITDTDYDERIIRLFTANFPSRPSVSPSDEFADMQWYPESNLPYERMPLDYQYWLPHVLGGKVVHFFSETDGIQTHVRTFTQQVASNGMPQSRFEEPVNEVITL